MLFLVGLVFIIIAIVSNFKKLLNLNKKGQLVRVSALVMMLLIIGILLEVIWPIPSNRTSIFELSNNISKTNPSDDKLAFKYINKEGEIPMPVMIKLKIIKPNPTLGYVRSLPGIKGLDIDQSYGLICISPKKNLFIIRAKEIDNVEERKEASPEILNVYNDVRISTFEYNLN
ncbi:MAG: hypothetical protein AAGA80_21210 [Cyanobacteria bacterium P01_F01_bin.143]